MTLLESVNDKMFMEYEEMSFRAVSIERNSAEKTEKNADRW